MTINSDSLLSSVYSSSSYSTTQSQTQISTEDDSSSFLVSSSSSELTETEQLYDADGDGVLSVTEKAAYLQAMSDKKAAETATSLMDSEEKNKQAVQKMQSQSSIKQYEILNKVLQPQEDSDEEAVAKADNEKEIMVQLQMRNANEAYKTQQGVGAEEVSRYSVAV